MRHFPEGKIRRLLDEPFAVTDAETNHVTNCNRCRARQQQIVNDAAYAASTISRPHRVPDVDIAWSRFVAEATAPTQKELLRIRAPKRHGVRLPVPSVRVIVATAALVVTGTTAGVLGAELSTPSVATQPTLPASLGGIEELVAVTGGDGTSVGGFNTTSGTLKLPFGTLEWSSAKKAYQVGSLSAAESATGVDVRVPTKLPTGITGTSSIYVQPSVTAEISFDSRAGHLDGQSLTVTAGPAVLVKYSGNTAGLDFPPLATFTMRDPTISSRTTSATASLEAYVLAAHGIPNGLEQELRFVADGNSVLPLGSMSGANASQVDIDGATGILVTDSSIGASGAIWHGNGVLNVAFGLLDASDLLNVARQIG